MNSICAVGLLLALTVCVHPASASPWRRPIGGVWATAVPAPCPAKVATRSCVVLVSLKGIVELVAVDTGVTVWAHEVQPCRGTPVVVPKGADGGGALVVVSTLETTLHALALEDGATVWSHNTRGESKQKIWLFSIAYDAKLDMVAVGSRDDGMLLVRARTGQAVSSTGTDAGVWGTPLVLSDMQRVIFPVTASSTMICVDVTDPVKPKETWRLNLVPGATHWKATVGKWIFPGPTRLHAKAAVVAFGDDTGFVRGVDVATGKVAWKLAVGGRVTAEAVYIASKNVLVGSTNFGAYCVQPQHDVLDGTSWVKADVKWKVKLAKGGIESGVAVNAAGTEMAVGLANGTVVRIAVADGSWLGEHGTSCGIVSSVATLPGGVVVAGCKKAGFVGWTAFEGGDAAEAVGTVAKATEAVTEAKVGRIAEKPAVRVVETPPLSQAAGQGSPVYTGELPAGTPAPVPRADDARDGSFDMGWIGVAVVLAAAATARWYTRQHVDKPPCP
jgi:outer membrane protein assembly factor BamB